MQRHQVLAINELYRFAYTVPFAAKGGIEPTEAKMSNTSVTSPCVGPAPSSPELGKGTCEPCAVAFV